MAPRKPKPDDDASSNTSELPPVLKPKNEKAKVTKPKAEKAKSDKPKVEKPKAVKKEKVEKDGEAAGKKEVKADGAKKEGDGKKVGEKEKVKAVNGEEAIEIMARYLKEQNRPYSATEVSANLHGKVTKTVADKLLKEMEQNGQIVGKATKKDGGGQWVFWGLQASDTLSPEQLASMDEQINTLKSSIPSLKTTQRNLTLKLNTLLSAPTTAALHTLISSIQQENKLKAEKLREFKEGAVKMVTKEEVSKVGREVKEWAVKRKKRMDAFKGLEAMLMQGPWSKEELWEKAGVEEDCYVPPSERQLLTPKY
ncbi:TBPIP-domain-containing protein [Hyaloscypha bicolor E]|uniref:TBPIP-domain-containing protein n=1 Tax=Hyaloscypha bicolor E TaxID=1095630 RepID=A0A2J6TVT1_9HELO|nr:TBPIP-domain-containing protein [Hyaloscypha bicolor E]PMD67101.1 TBPIP-domain-containing protein [Hyaloscypha bicolor E]